MNRPLLALAALALLAARADAAVLISIQQDATGVGLTLSGSLNTTLLTHTNATDSGRGIIPAAGVVFVNAGGGPAVDSYAINAPGIAFGPGGATSATAGSGGPFALSTGGSYVDLPVGYVSGSALAGSLTFAGQTLASLGLTPGTYTIPFNDTANGGANADTITVRVVSPAPPVTPEPPAPVPEPATLGACALIGVAGCGYVRRRLKAVPAVA